MMEKWNEVKTQTLRPEEIEALLAKEFGEKVNPVNHEELAKKHRSQQLNNERTFRR
ncbi:hypothetical protein [Anaeroselena agilis]|uniref:Uncharacterized protein n=1 Tax=Anaeroselena agilis TaxID=3063788 RepID=A0ABU3NZ70_9FIRM|nr:hypothetical protein [Selenomonadales bacterium 4137-cl]